MVQLFVCSCGCPFFEEEDGLIFCKTCKSVIENKEKNDFVIIINGMFSYDEKTENKNIEEMCKLLNEYFYD